MHTYYKIRCGRLNHHYGDNKPLAAARELRRHEYLRLPAPQRRVRLRPLIAEAPRVHVVRARARGPRGLRGVRAHERAEHACARVERRGRLARVERGGRDAVLAEPREVLAVPVIADGVVVVRVVVPQSTYGCSACAMNSGECAYVKPTRLLSKPVSSASIERICQWKSSVLKASPLLNGQKDESCVRYKSMIINRPQILWKPAFSNDNRHFSPEAIALFHDIANLQGIVVPRALLTPV